LLKLRRQLGGIVVMVVLEVDRVAEQQQRVGPLGHDFGPNRLRVGVLNLAARGGC
jgi:hypothetical protein